ncbi:hypothetical protein DENIT_20383 [Pseudomonas veronii]|nr:hypothetical protein DENIT_20383 [Pseudomonas veronii]
MVLMAVSLRGSARLDADYYWSNTHGSGLWAERLGMRADTGRTGQGSAWTRSVRIARGRARLG